jgi:hypothetical protein
MLGTVAVVLALLLMGVVFFVARRRSRAVRTEAVTTSLCGHLPFGPLPWNPFFRLSLARSQQVFTSGTVQHL